MTADKAALRKALLAEQRSLPEAGRRELDRALFERLVRLPEFSGAEVIFAFCSTGEEIDTHPVLQRVLDTGRTLLLPRCRPGGEMDAVPVAELGELTGRCHGIPQPGRSGAAFAPEEIDLCLVPGVAFDRAGYRLGRGGGYYDRYLPKLRGVTVGLCRDAWLVPAVPREPHDIPVDIIVTEKEIARLR